MSDLIADAMEKGQINFIIKYEPPLKIDIFPYKMPFTTLFIDPDDKLSALLEDSPDRNIYLNDQVVDPNDLVSKYRSGTIFIIK